MYTVLALLSMILGIMIIMWGVLGLIKPSWAKQPTRKKVLSHNFGLGLLIFLVSTILLVSLPESDQAAFLLDSTSSRSVNGIRENTSQSLREDFDINKIFAQEKSGIDDYLGRPNKCEKFSDSLFCQYDWYGTEIYFDEPYYRPRTVNVTRLPSLKFREKATEEIGLKITDKPDFSNKFVIKWDYFKGKEVVITSDGSKTALVSGIQLKAIPLTISHTSSSGIPMSAIVAFALEHLYEELNNRDHNDIATLNLYMDGLIDEYGNQIPARLVHSFELTSRDVKNLRRYNAKNLFHLKANEFQRRFLDELSVHP